MERKTLAKLPEESGPVNLVRQALYFVLRRDTWGEDVYSDDWGIIHRVKGFGVKPGDAMRHYIDTHGHHQIRPRT